MLSFSGIVTFPSATDLHDAARLCPIDSLLVETDSPYLAPVQQRGQRNQPAWVTAVGARVAELQARAVADIAEATCATAERDYHIPHPLDRRPLTYPHRSTTYPA